MTEKATALKDSVFGLFEHKIRPHAKEMYWKLLDFVENEVIPAEAIYEKQLLANNPKNWDELNYPPPIYWDLIDRAKKKGLWNLFLSKFHYKEGVDLTNLEYMFLAEITGRSPIAPSITNCNAPDTGNIEVLARYGDEYQKNKWLTPLLNGTIQSAIIMTERFVASSDATNIRSTIDIRDNEIVINGHKWWNGNPLSPLCKVYIFLGVSDPDNSERHKRHSCVIIPADTPGIKKIRPLSVMGSNDVPGGTAELIFENVRIPRANLVLGPGRGFEIMQGRLGPGRLHHCARSIGSAQLAIDKMIIRSKDPMKRPFGNQLSDINSVRQTIARSQAELEMMRMLVLLAADRVDKAHGHGALKELGMAKFIVPKGCSIILDRAIQMYGAEGVSQDQPFARMYGWTRAMRLADGPDDVHLDQVGRREIRRYEELKKHFDAQTAERDRLLSEIGEIHETNYYKTGKESKEFAALL